MTLREAVGEVLGNPGTMMTMEQICKQIEERRLFMKRKDGSYPDAQYVLFGIMGKLDTFEVWARLRK